MKIISVAILSSIAFFVHKVDRAATLIGSTHIWSQFHFNAKESKQDSIGKASSLIRAAEALKIDCYYPKDSAKFNKEIWDFDFNYKSALYGKTTMIIHCESEYGYYEFVFKKKINKVTDFDGDSLDVYKGNRVVGKVYNAPYSISEHNLYAFIMFHDHYGTVRKVKFQDFGNEIYWPEFVYNHCLISDENKDGIPEFYLSYMGDNDGLDPKPFKQIVYTFPVNAMGTFVKSNATAYYPVSGEEDIYRIEYDKNWNLLGKEIQVKSKTILQNHRKQFLKK